MNLADMLSYADIGQLSRIADTYDCECSGNSKNELIQSILSRIGRRDIIESQLHQLPIEDMRFLHFLLFDERDSFSLEELIARIQQARFVKEENEQSSPRDVLAKFKHYGWLFNGYSHQTKYLFQVPRDLKARFQEALSKAFQNKLVASFDPPVYRDEQTLIVDDIYYFLHYLHQSEVPLNAEGAMYKRNQQQIMDRFHIKEELVGRAGWRFGYGRKCKEYPNRFSLIYDYCYFQNYISEQPQRLLLTELGAEQVQKGKRSDLLEVYRFWLRLYKGPILNLQGLVYWIEKLAGKWVTVESVGQVLSPLIKPFYYDSAESILEQRILQMMIHLGLLRIGENQTGGQVIQITKLGHSVIGGAYVPFEDKIDLPLDKGSYTC